MRIDTAHHARTFMLAGNATLTIRSRKTGTRFTYKIKRPKNGNHVYFVKLLCGPSNTSDYKYIGFIRGNNFVHGGIKSFASAFSPSVIAFEWAFSHLTRNKFPAQLEVHHEGKCGACGRKLTVPDSIKSGIGPECAKRLFV